jgi:hypothetical protein
LAQAKMNENALSAIIIYSVTISRWHSAMSQGTPIWTKSLFVGISQFSLGKVVTKAESQLFLPPNTPLPIAKHEM